MRPKRPASVGQVLAMRGEVVRELKELAWLDPSEQSDARLGTLCSRPPPETLPGGLDPHDWPIFDRVTLDSQP